MKIANWIYLSHVLGIDTPGYGGRPQFSEKKTKQMSHGDSCNQSEWTFSNHVGTHMDAPFHFSEEGKKIQDYAASSWVFEHPHLSILSVTAGQLIEVADWCEAIPVATDFLLLKTEFEAKRSHEDYWAHNPGLSPELGNWLRANRPNVRAIGFDFISATSYDHRSIGKEAHRAFLHGDQTEPVLIVEDMHLAELNSSPKSIVLLPLRVQDADGAPVTVIAQL